MPLTEEQELSAPRHWAWVSLKQQGMCDSICASGRPQDWAGQEKAPAGPGTLSRAGGKK